MKLHDNIFCSATELPLVIAKLSQWMRPSLTVEPAADEVLPAITDPATVARWIDFVAGRAGFEADPEPVSYHDFRNSVVRGAPVVLQVTASSQPNFIVIIGAAGKALIAVDRDLGKVRLDGSVLRDFLFQRQRSSVLPEIERLLLRAGVENRSHSVQLLLEDRLADERITSCWTLRRQMGASVWRQAQDARLPSHFRRLMASYAAAYVLWLLSWWVLGLSALQGRLDGGWVALWALLLLTMIPLRLVATRMQGITASAAGWVCRQKLLHSTLRLDPDQMRSYGIGHFLGRALELEAIETVGFSGGALGVVALVELAAAAVVLATGAAPAQELLALLGWSGAIFALLLYYLRLRRRWTNLRLKMTHDLIERIVGHRTRVVQQAPERWHEGEDVPLERYFLASKRMDRIAAILSAFGSRGLVLLSMVVLAPAVMSGAATTFSIATTVGGALIASEAVRKIVTSMMQLADTLIAWQRIKPLMAVSAESHPAAEDFQTGHESSKEMAEPCKLIELKDVRFQHKPRARPVLKGFQLAVCKGEKVLLEGPSGSGKSTLVGILAGLRSPDSGLILLNGLDRHTLGPSGWRQKIAAAPQFHENHIFTETLAFNLLMGRQWPASAEYLLTAEAVCRELGLGSLLDRMPAGMMQMVGETGWQLSHGERGRVFMARALLQDSEMVVLDESFAALDPESLRLCVECVLNRSRTLLVVAHP